MSVLRALRQLALGFVLIAGASAVLLISDLGQRRSGGAPRVALFQHASQQALDEGVQGILAGLADNSFVDGRTMIVERFNAENDLPTANAIARQIAGGGYDLVLTASTLSLQTVANANREGRVRHVFGIVADPFSAGVGIDRANPLRHPRHLTGIGSFLPVRKAFEVAKSLYPALKSVGLVWNTAESNSEAFTAAGREACRRLGITLLEANVDNSSGVLEAANSLVARGAEALWLSGDVTVLVAADAVISAARKGRIPAFSIIPPTVTKGALFDLGANFHEVGRQVGDLAARVLQGADMATIPVLNIVPERLLVNEAALAGLKAPWRIPDDIRKRAEPLPVKSAPSASRPSKTWNVHIIALNNVLDVEESERGITQGLKEAKLEAGRDYRVTMRNAQGDMATLNSLVDATVAERADLLMTLSSPTLQAALTRVQGKLPIVFTYVANPLLAGAGRSDRDHLPNVTGVYVVGAYEDMIGLLRRCMPRVRKVGSLFVPAEVNMVYNKEVLAKAAAKAGLELVAMGVATSSEVPDAAAALVGRGVEALCQIGGNMTAASFGGIAQAARRARLPVFAFQQAQAREGAAVVLARDYFDAGREAAHLAARVMRGESPASIPFQPYTKTKIFVHAGAARAAGLTIPADLLAKATEVIRE
ncbi:MAG: ABC transporter substrate-binding protein [Bryobacteraceae bacterium]